MRATAGRKYRGGTAWNLNEEQDVYHGLYRRDSKGSSGGNTAKLGQGSLVQDLASKAKTAALIFKKYILIYLAVSGLRHCTRDFHCVVAL